MSEWIKIELGRLATKLVNGGTPPTDVPRYWSGKIPWITGADFTESGIGEFRRFVSSDALTETTTNVIERGQLLIVTRTGVGKLAIAPCDIAVSQDITGFYLDEKQVTPAFLYHRMRQGMEDLKKLNQGTSINGVVRGDLIGYPILLPPLPQQRRIAEILGTVDEAIEQTEALIAKQQQVKSGLMQDLFTRGLTAAGQLRPASREAPHLYQDSPLGPIPKEWEAHQITSVGEVITGNTPAETSLENSNRGIPFVTPGDVGDDVFVRATERSLTNRNAERARPIPVHSVCVVCIGSTIGKLAMVSQESVTNQQINSVVCRESALASFVYFSMSHFLPAQLRREAGLQAVPIVNKSVFSRLLVGMPREPSEAESIQARLLSASANIQSETVHLAKLRQQKQGLMQDLLTGRVSVTTIQESPSL